LAVSEEAGDLNQILYPDSGVWYGHILPWRNPYDLSRLDDGHSDWIEFGSDHYTALVKFYLAFRKYRTLIGCFNAVANGCETADLPFDIHDAIAGFWEHMCLAIDNLGRCFDDAPCLSYARGDGLKSVQGNYESLSFAYNRRTQVIHYSHVPVGFDDGTIIFNECHFDEPETTWSPAQRTHEWVNEHCIQYWKKMISQLSSVWYRLRDELKRIDRNSPPIPAPLKDPAARIEDGDEQMSGSGMLSVVQSNSIRTSSGKTPSEPYWVRAAKVPPSGHPYPGMPCY
jgi:hypothetical protein